MQAEDLDVVADVADDGELARREDVLRARARSARRRRRPRAGRLSRRNGEERARARAEERREPLEIGDRVDVRLELRDP